jgi:hypothetical protein
MECKEFVWEFSRELPKYVRFSESAGGQMKVCGTDPRWEYTLYNGKGNENPE